MNIGKYNISKTEFKWLPWLKVECEYEGEKEERGYVYVQRGWLWFSWIYTISFGWDNFQQCVEKGISALPETDYDGMGNFSRFGKPPNNNSPLT